MARIIKQTYGLPCCDSKRGVSGPALDLESYKAPETRVDDTQSNQKYKIFEARETPPKYNRWIFHRASIKPSDNLLAESHSMIHHMRLHNVPFRRIATGEQKLESRLFDEKRRKVALGDTIIFTNVDSPDETITTRVEWLLVYPSFNRLFADTRERYFPEYTWSQLEDSMLSYYSTEEEHKRWVVGIIISLDTA